MFVRVTAGAVLLPPSVIFPKLRVAGETVTGAAPVPLTPIVWGLLPASSVTVKVPERDPRAPGVKVTSIEQLAPAPRLDPQLLV